ncbi:HYR domain-containing protein [Cryomorphaceae bacterium 1068]|nr:HYR domain-containing protein [Cryomorphaceae bacterium 1068]
MKTPFRVSALSFLLLLFFFLSKESSAQVSITCPANVEVNNDLGLCEAVVVYTAPVGTGSGTNITTALTGGLTSGSAFPVGTTIVEYTVTNDEGDSDVCTFEVMVEDAEDPVIDCPPDIIVDANDGECTQVVTYPIPTASDNCGPVVVNQIGGLPSGSVFPTGESFLDFQTTDAAGNDGFCRIVVVVNDITPPEITCPDDIIVDVFNSCDTIINYVAPVGSDDCGPAFTTQIGGLGSGSVFPFGTTTETYEVTDADGNTATCSFQITVNDGAAPVITNCPADISQVVPVGTCEDVVNFSTPNVTDNCPGATIVQTDGPVSGSTFPVGSTEIEFTATDASGNTAVCSFTVTLTENTAPEITCPIDITVANDPGDCGAIVNYTPPEGTDNCPDPTTTQIAGLGSGAFFPVGTTTETYEVVDLSGNTAQCSFTVTVNDTEAPVIDCPPNIELSADLGLCEATATFGIPTFIDNCPGGTITQTGGPASGSTFPVGSTTIEFTAEDASGVQSICTFDVIITDDEDPVITCPDDIEITILSGACDTIVDYPLPTATDNCTDVIIGLVNGPAPGATLTAGFYTVTIGAQDDAGNNSTCSFTIDITETSVPTFDCPDDIEVNADPGACEATVTFDPPTAEDPCSDVTVTQTGGPVSGSVFPAGSTEIEFTAEDEFGNTEICTFNIVVIDDTDPTITCPEDISTGNDPSLCGAVVTYDAPVVDDNCGVAEVNLLSGLPSGDLFPVGVTTVNYEVVDVSGNTAQCSFTVTVTDDEAPDITCPADITLNIPDGDCSGVVNFLDATATDNCAIAGITQTDGLPSGSDFPVGSNTVTFEAVDANGLSATCSFTVTVLEGVAPEITCPADIEVNNDPGICGAVVSYTAPIGTDDCGGATTVLTAGLGSGAEFPVGVTIEEYTVTDLSGNTTTCSFTITVNDTELPVFDCPADLTVSSEPGICEATVVFDTPMVIDNCDGAITAIQTAGPFSGSVFPIGSTSITFEATDPSGNVETCSFDIIVEDNEAPVIDCPDDIEIDAGIACSTIVNFADATATDNCGIASIAQIEGPLSGSEFPVGVTTVTFEAIDDAGNPSTCSFTVTVTEEEPPVITCPEDIQVENDPDACAAIVTYDPPIASDDCGDVTVTLISGLASGESFPLGFTTVTYEAEDEQGNTATCSFDVEVVDAQGPDFDCPGEIQLPNDPGICGAVYTFDLPEASDNCPGDVTVIQTNGPASGTELAIGITSFSFEATDAAGNTSECTYDVVVSDTESPVFADCPEDIVIELESNVCDTIIEFETPTATDNCAVTALNQISGPLSGDVLTPGNYIVEFVAEDEAGNSTLCSFNITVQDVTPPTVDCPDSFLSCDLNVILPIPTALDSCGIASIIQTEGPESGTVFPIGITDISFEITDVNGNAVTCSYEVEVAAQATRPEAGIDRNICGSNSTTLSGNTPDFGSGLWFQIEGSGDILSPESAVTEVTNLGVGLNTFVWSIDPENGCDVLTDTVGIFVETGVIVDAGEDQTIILGSNAQLSGFGSPPDGTVQWSPPESLSCSDCLDPIASPTETTVYFLNYETPLGCDLTDSLTIKVFIKIPNTITPDGDNVNDVWNIPEIHKYPDVTVTIFNRWGVEVFSSTGYNEPWDGTTEGDDLPTGSYYYIIDYNREGKENLNGTVNIIR